MIIKKAETKLLAIWWFLVLIIITLGIVMGTSFFTANKLDVREAEAGILIEKVANCVIVNGMVNEKAINSIFDSCYLNEKIINQSSSYFIKIQILNSTDKIIRQYVFGNNALEADCKVGAAMTSAKKFPRCLEKSFFAVNSFGENVKLNLIAGSNYEFKIE